MKKFGSQKNFSPKNVETEQFRVPKSFGFQKVFVPKKLGPDKFWLLKILGPEKNESKLLVQKILGPKIILRPK